MVPIFVELCSEMIRPWQGVGPFLLADFEGRRYPVGLSFKQDWEMLQDYEVVYQIFRSTYPGLLAMEE